MREEIVADARSGALLRKLFGEYAYRSDEAHAETVDTLVALHNEGHIDLLQLLADAIPEGEGSDFFLGMMLYCELIPRLEAPVALLMSVVRHLVSAAGQDLAANQPNGAFRSWCSHSAARVDEVITLASRGSDDAQALLSFALEAGASIDADHYTDAAIEILRDGDGERQLAAVVALSRIPFLGGDTRAEAAAIALEKAVAERSDQNFQLNALRAAFELAMKAPRAFEAASRILDRQDRNDPYVVHACAQLLAFSADGMSLELLDTLLPYAQRAEAANKGTIDQLDFGLRQLWLRGEYDRVMRALEAILPRHGKSLSLAQFDSLSHEIMTRDHRPLEDLVVRWFLSGEFALCDNISTLVGRPTDQFEFSVDFARFGLVEGVWSYLARKAVGFFILSPVTAASFIVSLLRTAPEPEHGDLIDLLFDPILINYYGEVRAYCDRVTADANDPAAAAVAAAVARQEQYLEALRSVGEVRELQPSERQRRAEWRRHNDAMNAAYKAAEKKSIFSQLATRRVLLYGNRSIDYFRGPNEEKHRSELELKSISTSIEIPRIEIVDPVGLQYQLMVYRSERLRR